MAKLVSFPNVADISDDGSDIAFFADGRLRTIRASGINEHPTPTPGTDAVLSGDGRLLFVATDRSQILRIDLSTGAVEAVVPATESGWLYDETLDFEGLRAPGGLVRFTQRWIKHNGLTRDRPLPVSGGRTGP